jgi:hypothetical protein
MKSRVIIYAIYLCMKRESHISLYTAPNDLNFLWGVVYALNSLLFKFHQFWILYGGVMYLSYLHGWILGDFS